MVRRTKYKAFARMLGALAALVAASGTTLADPAENAPAATSSSIVFPNGDVLSGRLLGSDDPRTLVWASESFAVPLRFPLNLIHSIQFPRAVRPAVPPASYWLELSGGDTLAGSLMGLDENQLVIESPGQGTLHIDRASLKRIFRVAPDDLIFDGPSGLAGWDVDGPAKAWREEALQLVASQPGATLRRTFPLPRLAAYDIEISWKHKPNFKLAVGIDKQRPLIGPVFSLEVWGDFLVLVRESTRKMDFCSLEKIDDEVGHIQVAVFVDQQQGQVIAQSGGRELGRLLIPQEKKSDEALPDPPAARAALANLVTGRLADPGGIELIHHGGETRLERLAIRRWSGAAPPQAAEGQSWLVRANGQARMAEIRSLDAAARQFVVREGDSDTRLAEDELQSALFARASAPPPAAVKLVLAAGGRVSGELLEITPDRIVLQREGIREPLVFAVAELQSLAVSAPASESSGEQDRQLTTPEGHLQLPGVSLHGWLAGVSNGDERLLLFRPRHGGQVAPLSASAAGRLVFREPPKPKEAQPQASEPARAQPAVRVLNGIRTLLGAKIAPALHPAAPSESVLHLRSGDLVTCRVERIDEEGVWMKSAQASASFIAHAKIKALELRADAPAVKIEKAKFDRLLMLPRMQRTSPPQQLIRSLDGDYLRGRVLAMDEKQLIVEVHLEPRTIERSQVARIIWLHPDELAAKAEYAALPPSAVEPAAAQPAIRVQAVPPDNRRLTFTPRKLDGALLSGVSDVLGECRVDLAKIDQLLVGEAIDQDAASLVFHQWRLKPAPDPLPDPNEAGEPGENEGLESVLVGKPAPPIELETLDGNKFRLDDYKNQVLVLDFWASWCGPCLQTMSLVDRVVEELAGDDVRLMAINLQETPEKVRSALERLKLKMPVALDKDGRAAERYGATAIPQTVIIDRNGKVARVFVGGNSRFDEQLRQALQVVLSGRAISTQPESEGNKPTTVKRPGSEP